MTQVQVTNLSDRTADMLPQQLGDLPTEFRVTKDQGTHVELAFMLYQ